MKNSGYTIWIDTLAEGPMSVVLDENSSPVSFATERDAQVEIVDMLMIRLQEFLDGEREFEDAITVEEYVAKL